MTTRASKALLLFALGFYYSLVVFNNTNDYNSNLTFVRHVLLMDTTYPGNHGMWRAIHRLWIHTIFYDSIIGWEAATMLLTWAGAVELLRAVGKPGAAFQNAKTLAIGGLTVSLLMWLVAFLSVGGEWFLMWQSHTWNGQEPAFRMFVVIGVIFLLLVMPEEGPQS